MSQAAAIRLRKRFKINFRDMAKLGRPQYPRPVSVSKAARRLQNVIMKQRTMQQRKASKNKG